MEWNYRALLAVLGYKKPAASVLDGSPALSWVPHSGGSSSILEEVYGGVHVVTGGWGRMEVDLSPLKPPDNFRPGQHRNCSVETVTFLVSHYCIPEKT